MRLSARGLSNVWWPIKLHRDDPRAEKVLALWLNSTLGILTMIAHRVPTEGPWVQFKKPTLEGLPILDISALSESQLRKLSQVYDSVCAAGLMPLVEMANDQVRSVIDAAFATALDAKPFDELRRELAVEPVVCGRSLAAEIRKAEQDEDQLQFELL